MKSITTEPGRYQVSLWSAWRANCESVGVVEGGESDVTKSEIVDAMVAADLAGNIQIA